MTVSLKYGASGNFTCDIEPERIALLKSAPKANPHLREDLRAAMAGPLDFPPMDLAIIPDDHVVLALDRFTPEAALILEEVWAVLERRGVDPKHVVVLQPASLTGKALPDPRLCLPAEIASEIQWKVHDPADEASRRYIAATAAGERIYLARDLVEGDVVISIGSISYDSVIGYRGTSSVFYPGLSSSEAIAKAHGLGHVELGPDDFRPLRQVMDEIAWLLGTQFSIQVVASEGTGVSSVLAGSLDAVLRRGKEDLGEQWRVETDARPNLVVAAVDLDAGGHGWEQVGAALATARNLVAMGGKIVILSELADELGAGLEIVQRAEDPREALKLLRRASPPDLVAAAQVAHATDWARVYLLSQLSGDLVEDLFMVPLEGEHEVERLIHMEDTCAFLESAQNVYAHVHSA